MANIVDSNSSMSTKYCWRRIILWGKVEVIKSGGDSLDSKSRTVLFRTTNLLNHYIGRYYCIFYHLEWIFNTVKKTSCCCRFNDSSFNTATVDVDIHKNVDMSSTKIQICRCRYPQKCRCVIHKMQICRCRYPQNVDMQMQISTKMQICRCRYPQKCRYVIILRTRILTLQI